MRGKVRTFAKNVVEQSREEKSKNLPKSFNSPVSFLFFSGPPFFYIVLPAGKKRHGGTAKLITPIFSFFLISLDIVELT